MRREQISLSIFVSQLNLIDFESLGGDREDELNRKNENANGHPSPALLKVGIADPYHCG